MFTWLPLYKEISIWVLQYRHKQQDLINILQQVGFKNNLSETPDESESELMVMDPFTFFASFQKFRNTESRAKKLKVLKEIVGFSSPLPSDFNGLPSANAQGNVRFFPNKSERKGFELDTLWDLAEQAVKGKLEESTFEKALSIHGIGVPKLTQGLFWLNPEHLYPIDAHKSYLTKHNINTDVKTLNDYLSIIDKIKQTLSIPLYVASFEAWKSSLGEHIKEEETFSPLSLEKRMNKYEPSKYEIYISFLQTLVKDLSLASTDQRIVFSTGHRRLNFIVGQRYCLNLFRLKVPNYFGFITSDLLGETTEHFNGPLKAYFNESNDLDILNKHKDQIYSAIKKELARSKKSPHLDVDDPEFKNIIFSNADYSFIQQAVALPSPPLNCILYGPPGTGKTYESVRMAAEIVKNQSVASYTEAKQIFNDNLHNRIEFITFHQNYSYEDFIQGIRPDVENNKSLTFEKKDGVFKIIADRALQNLLASEKHIVLKKSFEAVFEEFFKPILEGEDEEIEVKMKKVSFFITEVGNKSIDFRKASGGTAHTLSIATLKKMYEAGTVLDMQGLSSYYSPLLEKLLQLGKISENQAEKVTKNNYVIIIDEINRANISRVFGELITLIEPDKRSHGSIPLMAKLPSGDTFLVPSNLYIIGTMNTADKSIALLDVALRRRFEFVSMYPKYEVVGHEIYDADILKSLNEQIISSKGHDFQIGHSYFMKENNELIPRMNNKVIPLLLEYYMNDGKEVKNILEKSGLVIDPFSWPLRITGRRD